MKKIILLSGWLLLLTACNGVDIDLQQEFDSIQVGDTVKEVLYSTHSAAPLYEEKFNFAGFEITRQEFRDVNSVYGIYLASTPLTEARVIAKSESKQNLMK